MKKLLIYTVIVLLLYTTVVIFLFIRNNVQQAKNCDNCMADKSVVIPTFINERFSFTVPIGWNVYENSDPQLLNTAHVELVTPQAYFSVSSQDRPVQLLDLNWQQLDFYITDGDYIGSNYTSAIKNTETETMQTVQNDYFEGYSSTSVLRPGETPSKANTGGTTYYLRPKISSPEWNLIVDKQALGDDEFENQVNQIIESLKFESISN